MLEAVLKPRSYTFLNSDFQAEVMGCRLLNVLKTWYLHLEKPPGTYPGAGVPGLLQTSS